MADLSELIERLKDAKGPSRILDYAIHEVTTPRLRAGLQFGNVPNYTASIDVAVSLFEQVLPGWDWRIENLGEDGAQGHVWQHDRYDYSDLFAEHSSSAIALVLATLRALQQKGSSNG